MPRNYRQLTDSVKKRLNPDVIPFEKSFSDELSQLSYSDVLVYIRLAMRGVEYTYTQKSKEAGERVKDHLQRNISSVAFRYQGSVMTNTHIKGHSDIDLLTISDKFYYFDNSGVNEALNNKWFNYNSYQLEKLQREVNSTSYTGNSLEDLRNLRNDCEITLRNTYSICDTTGTKSIKIKNLNLNREVDIVIANWYDDIESIINDKGHNRGIQVYNKEEHRKGKADFPSLSIDRINERSAATGGRLKKMIRFLKNVKADSGLDIGLNSFDFNAICYDISTVKYKNATFIELVPIIYLQLKSIVTNSDHAERLVSVDGREYIFKDNPNKLENVRRLAKEVESVFSDIKLARV